MDGLAATDDHRRAARGARAARRPLRFTTAASPIEADFAANRPLQAVVLVYALVWSWSVVDPVYRGSWILENLMTAVTVTVLVATYRRFPFSDLSYLMILVFLLLHAAGGHYTYAGVPLGRWLGTLLGDQRNQYDRLVHFSFGLLWLYPMRELCLRRLGLRPRHATLAAATLVLACSAVWEMIEWLAVCFADPTAAQAFLATQGDIWDAQKDMALAGLGVIPGLALIELRPRRLAAKQIAGD